MAFFDKAIKLKNAIWGTDGSYLESVKVANLCDFGQAFNERFVPNYLENIRIMISDCSGPLKRKALFDNSRKKILNVYKSFKNTFNQKSVEIQNLWNEISKSAKKIPGLEEAFMASYRKLIDEKAKLDQAKNKEWDSKAKKPLPGRGGFSPVTLRKNIEKEISSLEKNIGECQSSKEDIEKQKEDWTQKFVSLAKETEGKLRGEFEQAYKEATAVLRTYAKKIAGENEKKEREIFAKLVAKDERNRYGWGVTIREEAVRAKEMFEFFHTYPEIDSANFSNWIRAVHKDEFKLLKLYEETVLNKTVLDKFAAITETHLKGIKCANDLLKSKKGIVSEIQKKEEQIKELQEKIEGLKKELDSVETISKQREQEIKIYNEAFQKYMEAYGNYYSALTFYLGSNEIILKDCNEILKTIEEVKKIGIDPTQDKEPYDKVIKDPRMPRQEINLVELLGLIYGYISKKLLNAQEQKQKDYDGSLEDLEKSRNEFNKATASRYGKMMKLS